MHILGYIWRRHWVMLTMLSLLAALWTRSYYRSDKLVLFMHNAAPQQVISWHGVIRISLSNRPTDPGWNWSILFRPLPTDQNAGDSFFLFDDSDPLFAARAQWHRFGFARITHVLDSRWVVDWQFEFPHWCPMLLICTPLGFTVRRQRRVRKRRQLGQCIRCGYDLRASPDRCPECGEKSPYSAVL